MRVSLHNRQSEGGARTGVGTLMLSGINGQLVHLDGMRMANGATVAPWGPGFDPGNPMDRNVPATGLLDASGALGGRGGILIAAQSDYVFRQIANGVTDEGALIMDAGAGGMNQSSMLAGEVPGDNYYYMLSEMLRCAAEQDIEVTIPEIIHYIGTSSKGETYAVASENLNALWTEQSNWVFNALGTRPDVFTGQTGGDCNTAPDLYEITAAQYDLTKDWGGEIATSQRIWPIADNNIHTDVDVSVKIGEVVSWCRTERNAGRKWTPWYTLSRTGNVVTVSFDLRPGETLVDRPSIYNSFGGASTALNYGFEAQGGVNSVVPDFNGNTVQVTLNNSDASWFRFASQRQDVLPFGVPTGPNTYNMSSHRTTLFPSETRESRFYPGELLWRSLPSFSVLIQDGQFRRLNGQPL